MIQAKTGRYAPSVSPFPLGDTPPLDPSDRLTGGVTRGRDCHRPQSVSVEVMHDAGQVAVIRLKYTFQKRTERCRV
jgi:hypothetical protein